jgi:hypothetical protein
MKTKLNNNSNRQLLKRETDNYLLVEDESRCVVTCRVQCEERRAGRCCGLWFFCLFALRLLAVKLSCERVGVSQLTIVDAQNKFWPS